jgi:hypothetical protein
MQLNPAKTTFGRHETFPLRYGWLTKGFMAVQQNPAIFSQPESAMVVLGVGRNMVNAIQYWLRVTGMVDFNEGTATLTALGNVLLGADGDPYLEDEASLWIIHWLIASNAELATGFFWFFNRFIASRFQEPEALQALTAFAAHELNMRRAQTTLKSDLSTLLRMYAPIAGRSEEHLDSPLAQLQLVEVQAGRQYRSLRITRPFLPSIALHFALLQRFVAEPHQPALPIRNLLSGSGDWAAVGAVFRLNEEGLMNHLARVIEHYPHCYELRDTAGVHQLYRSGEVIDPLAALQAHYEDSV